MASHNLKRSKLQRTKDSISNKTFSDLPISEILKQALLKTNFNQTTPIQNKALSKIRCSANKIIHGKSGTGKTMIFSILAIEKYLRINVSQRREGNAGLISVILCPTREIAIQGYFTMFEVISEVNRKLQEKSSKSDENNQRYGGYNLDKIKLALAIGGTNEDRDSLIHSDPISRANILIGTTGKIRSFLRSKKCSLKKVRIICFDEADKLFESRKADRQAHDKQNSSKERTRKSSKDTMRQQVISILEDFELPNMVQYVGLSATFDENLQKDLNGIMNEYIYIKSDENEGNQNENDDNRRISQLQGVLQYFVELPARSKLDLKIKTAFEITQICPYTQAIIFCSNRSRVERAYNYFLNKKRRHYSDNKNCSLNNFSNFTIQTLSSTLSQIDRERALLNIRNNNCRITIASDLASRGIDASGVDLVIHLDGASDWQTHQHRVGRGGRLGTFAVSIAVFVDQLGWDVDLKEQLKENKIEMSQLGYDIGKLEILPLPNEVVTHILESGREIGDFDKKDLNDKNESQSHQNKSAEKSEEFNYTGSELYSLWLKNEEKSTKQEVKSIFPTMIGFENEFDEVSKMFSKIYLQI